MHEITIRNVQEILQKSHIDGWLIYDFQKRNSLAIQFLDIPPSAHLTRRMFYWIPAKGSPVKIVHVIEPHFLDKWPGEKQVYFQWQKLEETLSKLLSGSKTVAMEYSPKCAIPYASIIDAGMADLIRSFGVEIVSSSGFLQYFTCVLDEEQRQSQQQAALILDQAASDAWQLISSSLKKGERISEYQVQQFIKSEFTSKGCISQGDPICAVNAHSSDPHFSPSKENDTLIQKGDFVLIDLWCKKNTPKAIYGDISRVAVAAVDPSDKQKEIFSIVRRAQKAATDFIIESFSQNKQVRGCDADKVARDVIENAGYGQFFTHRTGHNIHTDDHGPGTHLDSLETKDERPLIPGTCFSIEPGIYLPGEFGVRLEYDVYISPSGKVEVTGGIQEEIVTLM